MPSFMAAESFSYPISTRHSRVQTYIPHPIDRVLANYSSLLENNTNIPNSPKPCQNEGAMPVAPAIIEPTEASSVGFFVKPRVQAWRNTATVVPLYFAPRRKSTSAVFLSSHDPDSSVLCCQTSLSCWYYLGARHHTHCLKATPEKSARKKIPPTVSRHPTPTIPGGTTVL